MTPRQDRLQTLVATVADLTASPDAEALLARVPVHAATLLGATGSVLVLDPVDDRAPGMTCCGVARERADEVAGRLRVGGDPGPGVVVAEVASATRHGLLAVLDAAPEHAGGPQAEEAGRLLAVCAGLAAAALDARTAERAGAVQARRAAALLTLPHQLAGAEDRLAVAELVAAALPGIVGSDSAAMWLWHPDQGEIRTAATAGLRPELHAALLAVPVRPSETPELVDLLARRAPLVLAIDEVSPPLRAMLDGLGQRLALGVPLRVGPELLGAATASWVRGPLGDAELEEAVLRLQGVADQAAVALRHARLVETVRHQALHDALTRLPNRVLFHDRLDTALQAAQRGGGVAVLHCDLDRFKRVNDELGHAAGDELLRQVAGRLQAALRPGDTVARLGGDEFAVLLPGVVDATVAADAARRVLAGLERPFRLEGRHLRVTASIGVAVHVGPGGRRELLLRAADQARYDARRRGRHQVALSHAPSDPVPPASSSRHEVREALETGQLRMFLQPVVDLTAPPGEGLAGDGTGRVVGAEALLRWEHPRLGLLAPAAFVPLAEEDGSVVDLDLWVLRAACTEAATWPGVGGTGPHVSVNLAERTLRDDRLDEAVRLALLDSGLPASRLTLEVVESRALLDLPGIVERLAALRYLGVRVALDDFGTGFSTLTWLQQLPVDVIKVDRSFVVSGGQAGAAPGTGAALLRGVVALGRELGLTVVAEGVETPEQRDAVRAAGCGLAQGYLFGRPAPVEQTRLRLQGAT